MGLFVRNLADVLKTECSEFVTNVINSFSCKYNKDVDDYLKNGFVPFDSRVSDEDGVTYDLMFSFLK